MTAATGVQPGGGIRAWLELARISNLPTCFTNVLVGCAIGVRSSAATGGLPWGVFAGVSVAVGLLYVGGMILNDAVDATVDAAERRARPIPSGRVSRRTAFVVASVLLAAGVAALAPFGLVTLGWGVALVATIVTYDVLHKRVVPMVFAMGVCRGLVFIVATHAVTTSPDWRALGVVAAAMTLYVAVVTAFARSEHATRPGPFRAAAFAVPLLVLLPALAIPMTHPDRVVAAAACVVLWLGRSAVLLHVDPARPRDAIMGWLAGICLADAFTLALLGERELMVAAFGLFAVTWLGHRRIPGT